jgi:flagellar protein FlaF
MNPSTLHYASKVYAKTAKEVADPRQLEASLLLEAAARLQAVHDSWDGKPPAALADIHRRRHR